MGKYFKFYKKKPIGFSNIHSLILVGCDKFLLDNKPYLLNVQPLYFGYDGGYSAYIVDGAAEIGSYYVKIATFYHWLKIYDDDGLECKFDGEEINVFVAGDFGCIIQIIK